MKTRIACIVLLALGLAFSVSASATGQGVVQEPKAINKADVSISDHKFAPDYFQTSPGSTILFHLTNTTDTDHNFTIKDPDGKTIKDIDILPGKTADVGVSFSRAGTYEFYCNKDLHRQMGMKGKVIAAPK